MKRIIVYSILIISIVLIEAAAISNWYLLPVKPDIMLIVLMFIAMENGSTVGQVTGFFSGLLIDFLSAAPFGLNALIRTVLGFFAGVFHLNIHSKGILIPILMLFFATLSKALLIFFVSFFYPGKIMLYSLFNATLWYECLFNSLLAPLVFFALSKFKIFSADFKPEHLA